MTKADFDFPMSGDNEYEYDFRSERAARNAARDSFSKYCYSPSADRPVLKKIFVEYKVDKLQPFYTTENKDASIYLKYIKDVENMLKNIKAEIEALCSGNMKMSEEWCSINIPVQKISYYSVLNEYENQSEHSEIISELQSMGKYTSLDWYVDRMDYNECAADVKEGIFGIKEIYK